MDLRKYDELRKKINTKDFEGNNKGLDKWLYGFSFIGNFGSIFFAYFLVFPSLLKAITINVIDGFWGTTLAFLFTNTFLIIFEIIKRYLVKNFSGDYVANNNKIKPSIFGWFLFSLTIISLSFYLSVVGSRNLASTSNVKNTIAQTQVDIQKDNLSITYEEKKKIYEVDNQSLREVNAELRKTLAETPLNYMSARKEYQTSIDKNTETIENNQKEIRILDEQLKVRVEKLKSDFNDTKTGNANEDTKNIVLFVIIAIFVEIMIISGIYFREFYEYKLYLINQQKFEKIYQKKERYKSLLTFVYNDGKSSVGDKVISGMELKEIVGEKSNIDNHNKFVEHFLKDMDNLGVFNTVGKRRFVAVSYNEAQNMIEHFDDTYRVLENLK